jgi:hypothetical protein
MLWLVEKADIQQQYLEFQTGKITFVGFSFSK